MNDHHKHDLADERSHMQQLAREHQDVIWGTRPVDTSALSSETKRRTAIPGLGLLAGAIGPKSEIGGQLRNLSVEQRRARSRVSGGSTIPGAGLLVAATFGAVICAAIAALALITWLVA